MKKTTPPELERCRVLDGPYGSDASYGMAGAFKMNSPIDGTAMLLVSSGPDTESGWEHVSASTPRRTPSWAEMCFIKDLFWYDTETVVQYHPPRSEYVNLHPHTLHCWKPIGIQLPLPSSLLVGPKTG